MTAMAFLYAWCGAVVVLLVVGKISYWVLYAIYRHTGDTPGQAHKEADAGSFVVACWAILFWCIAARYVVPMLPWADKG